MQFKMDGQTYEVTFLGGTKVKVWRSINPDGPTGKRVRAKFDELRHLVTRKEQTT